MQSSPFRVDRAVALQIRALSRVNAWRALAAIVADWAVIAAAFTAALVFPHPAVWGAAAALIATRQHALLILMHDASHQRLLGHPTWNDRISNWLLAWPLLVSTEGYRQNHLAHHVHLNTDSDPDWVRKAGKPAWEFPKTRWQLLKLLGRDFLGGGVADQFKAIRDLSGQKLKQSRRRHLPYERLAFYAVAAVAVAGSGLWLPVLLLWFLPAFTLLPVILRIRSIAEHFGVEGDCEVNMSRNVYPTLWERLLLAPHNVGYHLDHHLYPAVPCYNLPQLHDVLQTAPAYTADAHQSRSLFGNDPSSVINEVCTTRTAAAGCCPAAGPDGSEGIGLGACEQASGPGGKASHPGRIQELVAGSHP